MIVYVCLAEFDHEGDLLDGLYLSASGARRHNWDMRGDSQRIEKWSVTKKACRKIGEILLRKPKRGLAQR